MKKYSKSTLEHMPKEKLIDLYECELHNHQIFKRQFEIQSSRLEYLTEHYGDSAFDLISLHDKLNRDKFEEIEKICVNQQQ